MYVGNRHARIRGERYDNFIDAYVTAVTKLFPHALLQWEDFAPGSGRRIMQKYRHQICTFNEDMQGTITLSAAISAVRICGTPLRAQRIVIFGAGTAGIGIADQICDAMVQEGLSRQAAISRIWCLDRNGLLSTDAPDELLDYQLPYARPSSETKGWKREGNEIGLAEIVRRVKPSMLIGVSATAGSFTEEIVRQMASYTERPIIFALSHPVARIEAHPRDLIAWTDGRALVATGCPFAPVTFKGVTHVIAQVNNAMLYPGLALGAIVARASRISDGMLAAAANAVSSLVTVRQAGASLLPHIDALRAVSMTVAGAVADAAQAEGLAGVKLRDLSK